MFKKKEMFRDIYNFNLWFKKVNITDIQNKSLCYGFSNNNMQRKHDAFVCNFNILKLSVGRHSELVKFKLKIYYIWRATLGKISKKRNNLPCSHHNTYLNTGILSDLSALQIYGLLS